MRSQKPTSVWRRMKPSAKWFCSSHTDILRHVHGGVTMFRKSVLAGILLLSLAASAQTSAPAASGVVKEFLTQLDDLEKKAVSLAEAVPQEKYGWRPGEGVRSVGEVYAHITAGNYAFGRPIGVKAPADLDLRNVEK